MSPHTHPSPLFHEGMLLPFLTLFAFSLCGCVSEQNEISDRGVRWTNAPSPELSEQQQAELRRTLQQERQQQKRISWVLTNEGRVFSLEPIPRGEITALRLQQGFVVIDFLPGIVPQNGAVLEVYRDGKPVGRVRLTGPWVSRRAAADILEGHLEKGDRVYGGDDRIPDSDKTKQRTDG